jgi:hypothetical protein
MTKYFMIRQNPYKHANQHVMHDLNNRGVLTAPFAHTKEYTDNFLSETFSDDHPLWSSQGQDVEFNNIQVGDVGCILYPAGSGITTMLVCRVTSNPLYQMGEQDQSEICYDTISKTTSVCKFPFVGIKRTIPHTPQTQAGHYNLILFTGK